MLKPLALICIASLARTEFLLVDFSITRSLAARLTVQRNPARFPASMEPGIFATLFAQTRPHNI